MRKFRLALFGGVLIAGMLAGPGIGSASAASFTTPTAAYSGWDCHPDGSGTLGPTTTLSGALIFADPAKDVIGCLFQGYTSPDSPTSIQFGGECYFNIPGGATIEFSHRAWVVSHGDAHLACWGGAIDV